MGKRKWIPYLIDNGSNLDSDSILYNMFDNHQYVEQNTINDIYDVLGFLHWTKVCARYDLGTNIINLQIGESATPTVVYADLAKARIEEEEEDDFVVRTEIINSEGKRLIRLKFYTREG